MKAFSYCILFVFCKALIFAQASPDKLKIQKEFSSDSVFFDFTKFKLYTRTADKNVMTYKDDYSYHGKTRGFSGSGSHLPKKFKSKLYSIKAKTITVKFYDLEPYKDSLYMKQPYKLLPFTYTVKKRLSMARFLFGAWSFPLPFLTYDMVSG